MIVWLTPQMTNDLTPEQIKLIVKLVMYPDQDMLNQIKYSEEVKHFKSIFQNKMIPDYLTHED